jgi:hypothetical protein
MSDIQESMSVIQDSMSDIQGSMSDILDNMTDIQDNMSPWKCGLFLLDCTMSHSKDGFFKFRTGLTVY